VSLDGRDPRPMEDIASLPPSMPGFVTSRNQEVDYFNNFFPSQLVTWMVECTNANFRSFQKHTDQVEMENFLGVVIAMTVSPATGIDDYWSTEDNDFMQALKFWNE